MCVCVCVCVSRAMSVRSVDDSGMHLNQLFHVFVGPRQKKKTRSVLDTIGILGPCARSMLDFDVHVGVHVRSKSKPEMSLRSFVVDVLH